MPWSRGPFCSSEGQGSSIITSAQEKGRDKGSRTPPPQDSGTHQVPSYLTGSGHRLWSLSPHSAQLVSSPPHYGPSLPDLTQERGDKPECKGLQGHVWELQDFTDCSVQLMGTDGGQVLHGQGHYCVISQVYQYISCWNTGWEGSGEVQSAFSTTLCSLSGPRLH